MRGLGSPALGFASAPGKMGGMTLSRSILALQGGTGWCWALWRSLKYCSSWDCWLPRHALIRQTYIGKELCVCIYVCVCMYRKIYSSTT